MVGRGGTVNSSQRACGELGTVELVEPGSPWWMKAAETNIGGDRIGAVYASDVCQLRDI
jgi:hypothetical protein